MNRRVEARPDLLSLSFELTVYGISLSLIMAMSQMRLNASSVATICVFLAVVFVFKLVYPINSVGEHMWKRFLAIAACGGFAWWLIYQAENTRVGWYRFNVLQQRVESFVAHAPAYVILADPQGVIKKTSDNIRSLTGYEPAELVGKPVTLLMRAGPAARHEVAFAKAIEALRRPNTQDAGWLLQGVITVGVVRKDGTVAPVKAYAGGIRWSTDIQFEDDTDLFAVFVPVPESEALKGSTTIKKETDIKAAPQAPVSTPLPLSP